MSVSHIAPTAVATSNIFKSTEKCLNIFDCFLLTLGSKYETETESEKNYFFNTLHLNYVQPFTHTHFSALVSLCNKNCIKTEVCLSEMSLCSTSLQPDLDVNFTFNQISNKAKVSPEDNTVLEKHTGHININI
jgi:predicted ATP-dependent Lon-type protease